MTWPQELAGLTDSWPSLCPPYLAAAEQALPEIRPFHTIAHRGRGELAMLPGYVLEAPAAAAHDPRACLGGAVPAAMAPGGTDALHGVMEAGRLFPCLLLGSPLGYRSEVAYNFWTRQLFGDMATRLIQASLDEGIRCIAAPWVPDRSGNADLVSALVSGGGHATFYGYEDFTPLREDSWDAYLSGLPEEARRHIAGGQPMTSASGVEILRLDGERIRPHLTQVAALACRGQETAGPAEQPGRIAAALAGLLDSGVDVRAYLGLAGSGVVSCCVAVRKEDRLFTCWSGVSPRVPGERDSLHFALAFDAPVRDAFAEGLRAVEFGVATQAGIHRARQARGCRARAVTTVLHVADESIRPAVAQLHEAFGQGRKGCFE
jgi:hypothetical protein